MSKQKSQITVRLAVEQIFDEMPSTFHAIFLCKKVKVRTGRMALMDGTILRRLRELREEKPQQFGYICKDQERSIYTKQALNKYELV